jgi:hypothetical protein
MLSLLTEKDFNEYLWNTDFGEKLELISEEKTEITKQSIYTFKLSKLKHNHSIVFTVYMTSQFNANEENNLEYKTFKDNKEIGFNGIRHCSNFSQTVSVMKEIQKAVETLAEDCHRIMSRID